MQYQHPLFLTWTYKYISLFLIYFFLKILDSKKCQFCGWVFEGHNTKTNHVEFFYFQFSVLKNLLLVGYCFVNYYLITWCCQFCGWVFEGHNTKTKHVEFFYFSFLFWKILALVGYCFVNYYLITWCFVKLLVVNFLVKIYLFPKGGYCDS